MQHGLGLLALCFGVLTATQAAALSCLRPDAARTFLNLNEAPENYVVLMGRFSVDGPPPPSLNTDNPQTTFRPARFVGSYLGADGFVEGAALDLTVAFTCAGPWCGSLPQGRNEILAFVQQTDSGYVLEVDPCGTTTFINPREAAMQQVESCIRGEGCEEEPMR